MSELHEVEVLIDPQGNVRLEVRGLAGPGCLEVTRELEALLGGKVVARERTHEFDLRPDTDGVRGRQR